MKITNVHNLPHAFMNFGRKNSYDHGHADMGVTTLIDSAKIRQLKQEHESVMEEDVSERVMSILGTAVHNILESGASEDDIVEERLYGEMDGMTFSGQIDLRSPVGKDSWKISDYKTCAAFSIKKNPEGKPEWENQLNVYRLLAELNGHDIESIEVVAVIRDWTRSKAERDANYPQAAVVRIPVKLWTIDRAVEYAMSRIREHTRDIPSQCTPEEMWESPPIFAVHKVTKTGKIASRASRLFDTLFEASSYVEELGYPVAQIQTRPGKRARCEGNYCNVSEFCNQYAEYQRGNQ